MAEIMNLKGEIVSAPYPPQDWIIRVIGDGNPANDITYHKTGYFKFGAQFVAILDGEKEDANLIFTVPTNLFRSAELEEEIEVTA